MPDALRCLHPDLSRRRLLRALAAAAWVGASGPAASGGVQTQLPTQLPTPLPTQLPTPLATQLPTPGPAQGPAPVASPTPPQAASQLREQSGPKPPFPQATQPQPSWPQGSQPQSEAPIPQSGAAPGTPPSVAEPQSASERRVKAAFLYKFLGYTEFPSTAFGDPVSPVRIGVAGSDDMLAELSGLLAGRTLKGRPIFVRAVREGDNPGQLHLLFVAGSDPLRVARVVRAAPGALLIVSECEGGLQQGSVINFRMVDEYVRFDVSLDAAEKNNVRLSSRLLGVASHVQKGNI